MFGHIFNSYSTRAIDSALFSNSISRIRHSKVTESNGLDINFVAMTLYQGGAGTVPQPNILNGELNVSNVRVPMFNVLSGREHIQHNRKNKR